MRFTTVELSELETKMITAADQALKLELKLFEELLEKLFTREEAIIETARGLAQLDVSSSLALLALENHYVRPQMSNTRGLRIVAGRHPVVEAQAPGSFIANDCALEDGQNIWLMTGPNMAGKSTFLRQNGLIVIMAQIGSFVPAKSAHMGIVDKLFSRVGASDDLASGRSTFMVEMVETATILNQATDRSLVILDEVGRGTATFDGMSIAWAVIEHLGHNIRPLCLFATHYHELTTLQVPGLACYTMRIKEWEGQIFFLHEVLAGQADRSYGLHVAALAGLPPAVIERAQEVLVGLESPVIASEAKQSPATPVIPAKAGFQEPSLFDFQKEKMDPRLREDDNKKCKGDNKNGFPNDTLYTTLAATDLDTLTPRQALEFLYALKERLP
jgi:DNA mismatch repair protein MutS